MRANEFITEKKSRKKTKVRKATYGPGLYGGYGYFSTYGNSDSTGGDGGGDGGESIHENITPNTIHKLADRKGVKWDNEPSFLQLTKRLTGKEHLDDLDQVGLQKVQRHLEKQGVAEGQDDKAEAYRAHLIKTLPQIMKLFANIGKGWIPSKEQMLSAVDTAYIVMKHTGDVKQAGKVLMDELNTLYRMSQGKKGIDENFADGRNPQDKGDAKRHGVNTKGSVSSLRKTAKQGGRKGQLAHWMANMKAGRNK